MRGGPDSNSEYIYTDNICFILGLAGETDTDGDGIPEAWESSHGLNPNDGTDGSQDADRDGQTNRQEYAKRSIKMETFGRPGPAAST
ncbi:MAG: hypothetical protein ACR2OZ_13680 [Verrucomicrobiales bacterium]